MSPPNGKVFCNRYVSNHSQNKRDAPEDASFQTPLGRFRHPTQSEIDKAGYETSTRPSIASLPRPSRMIAKAIYCSISVGRQYSFFLFHSAVNHNHGQSQPRHRRSIHHKASCSCAIISFEQRLIPIISSVIPPAHHNSTDTIIHVT
jgi:hypothetical protein